MTGHHVLFRLGATFPTVPAFLCLPLTICCTRSLEDTRMLFNFVEAQQVLSVQEALGK